MNDQIKVPVLKTPDQQELAPAVTGKEAMKTASESTEIFQLMESRDEGQMMEEIMGVFSHEYVYDIPFKQGSVSTCSTPGCQLMERKQPHVHVRGLSWSGIKEARRIFKAIDTREVLKPIIIEHDGKQYYECKVTAVDLRTGNVTTTFKRHPLMKARKDGSLMEDPYAFEIVQSKAKRNAISELLPQPLIRGWIGDWVNGKKDFDPKRAIELQQGQDYQVQKDSQKDLREEASKAPEHDDDMSKAKPETKQPHLTKILLDKVNATLKEFESKGGVKISEATKQYCAHFKVKYLYYLSTDQANQIIGALNSRIAKIDSAATEETTGQASTDNSSTPATKNENIQSIKIKLINLGWDLSDPKLVSSLLKPYGLNALKDLDRADDILVSEILDKVTGPN